MSNKRNYKTIEEVMEEIKNQPDFKTYSETSVLIHRSANDYKLKSETLLKIFEDKEIFYAKKCNRVVYDVAIDISNSLKKFKLFLELHTKDDIDISKEYYSNWNLFPLDLNKCNYKDSFRKCNKMKIENSIPICYQIIDFDDINTNAQYVANYYNDGNKFIRLDISEKEILIKIAPKFFNSILTDYNKFSSVFSHELQHAFDDNIIYNTPPFLTNKKVHMNMDVLNYVSYNKFPQDIQHFITEILYFISKDETKARETEVATSVTNLVRDKEMKIVFNDEYERVSSFRLDKALKDYNSSYIIHERISDLIAIIANYPQLQHSIPINNTKMIFNYLQDFKQYKDNSNGINLKTMNQYEYTMFFIGIIMKDNNMFNQSLFKGNITMDNIKKVFTEQNLIYCMNWVINVNKFDEYIELVYENIMYLICYHLNTIYKIIHDKVDEVFDFKYEKDYDIENSINESYSYFEDSHTYYIDLIYS